jgi:hypothetical protein
MTRGAWSNSYLIGGESEAILFDVFMLRRDAAQIAREPFARCSGERFILFWPRRGRFCARDRRLRALDVLTTPNAVTSTGHDRMPVILDPDGYDLWPDPGMNDMSAASELLSPCDAPLMRSYPVSSRVNSAVNDDEACSAPVGLAEAQARLFS